MYRVIQINLTLFTALTRCLNSVIVIRIHEVIFWLTGYDEATLHKIIEHKTNFEDFFKNAPQLHPNVSKITGVICGYRVEEIENPLMQKIRYLDKLVDELAKGKAMEKILRP